MLLVLHGEDFRLEFRRTNMSFVRDGVFFIETLLWF
jgi:hypothetical protein